MILERTQSEIVVRLPLTVDLKELQEMLDYFKYKDATSQTRALQTDADNLAVSANKAILEKFKKRRGL